MSDPFCSNSNHSDDWQYSPEKQAKLRDAALAAILMKSNKAQFADLRLGDEVLARDSKKTGYFPARLVCKCTGTKKPKPAPHDHVRIHYDGRPEGEYRDIPKAHVYYLPDQDHFCHLNILLSPWVLLDEMHNFENTPLLAYAKVFERTDFRKMRVLFDGSFEMVDRKGRIVKVKADWVRRHSTAHPDAIQEAVEEAQNHERFLDLIYGASHAAASTPLAQHIVYGRGASDVSPTKSLPDTDNKQSPRDPRKSIQSKPSTTHNPIIPYPNDEGESNWLAAAFANAIHYLAKDKRDDRLQESAISIDEQGKRLPVTSKLRTKFTDLVNRITNPLGYRMEALRFFNLTHESDETGAAPVVAFINMGNGYGRCVSFYRNWVLDPSRRYAIERTPEQLAKLYGEGVEHKAVWSYCLLPLGATLRNNPNPTQDNNTSGGLVKKKSCRKRSRGGGKNHHDSSSGPSTPPPHIPDKRSRYN